MHPSTLLSIAAPHPLCPNQWAILNSSWNWQWKWHGPPMTPILDSTPSSQGWLECFCAYVMLILPQVNIPLVAYDGAIAMEPILSYFEIGTSWKGDLWACPLCFVSHLYLAWHYLNDDTLCHLHLATCDCIIIGVQQMWSWSAREMPSIPSWPLFPISYFSSISLP